MKFGVREICDVVFKAKSNVQIGKTVYKKGQPVLYIDTAKTSTLEGAATTVYAQGGKGNTRLITWEGEKTITFTVEDALLSPLGFSILSGAGLIKGKDGEQTVNVHTTTNVLVEGDDPTGAANTKGIINLADALTSSESISAAAPLFVLGLVPDGSATGEM